MYKRQPYIKAAGEMKTKPTQQSVAKLREIGIQPDVIICRTEYDMSEDAVSYTHLDVYKRQSPC